jgi:hypothetical protein
MCELLKQYQNQYDKNTLYGNCSDLFKNQNNKDEWEKYLLSLRQKMDEKGFFDLLIENHKIIEPVYIINFLITEIDEEFKLLRKKSNNGNNNAICMPNFFEIRNNRDKAYEWCINNYKNNFGTHFSIFFFNTLERIKTCKKCNEYQEFCFGFVYSFRLDIKFLREKYKNTNEMDIKQAFNCCINKSEEINNNKMINFDHQCNNQNLNNNIEIKKKNYELSEKIVIFFFDRGDNCRYKNYIRFDEEFSIDNSLYYFLKGVICRIEEFNENEKKREVKYIHYIKEKDGKYSSNYDGEKHDFNDIKYTGDIIHLFYENTVDIGKKNIYQVHKDTTNNLYMKDK